MLIAIITNFAIIFSSTILFYWILSKLKQTRKLSVWENRLLSIIVGLSFGIISLVITILFLDIAHNLLVNTRFIPYILSGLIGGPIAMFANAVFIFFIRMMLGFETMSSLIFSLNALTVGTLLGIFALYKPVTLKNIHPYFTFLLVEVSLILLVTNEWSPTFFGYFAMFIAYATALYLVVIYFIKYSKELTLHANKSVALNKVDFLTQLPNNLALENQLQAYIHAKIPFEMVHLDIDLFKHINIEYGYRNGDLIVTELAQAIKLFAEQHQAYVARIGGDEFCYVRTHCSPAEMIIEVHELSKLIQNMSFLVNDKTVKLTLSGSIISYPTNAETLHELFTASNYALKIVTETQTNTITHINQIKQQYPNY